MAAGPQSVSMSGDIAVVAFLALLTLLYFGVLVVVALDPPAPGRRGRHRRDLGGGAR